MQAETMFRNILTCLRTLTALLGQPFLFATNSSLLNNRDFCVSLCFLRLLLFKFFVDFH